MLDIDRFIEANLVLLRLPDAQQGFHAAGEAMQHQIADGGGEHVHALVDEHVVGAPVAADARARAAAGAAGADDLRMVARAVANEWRRLARERGVDDFAGRAVAPGHGVAGVRIDQFHRHISKE